MKRNIYLLMMALLIVGIVVLTSVSCSKTEKYPAKYAMNEKTWDRLLDYYIEEENISEQELAAEGGKEQLRKSLISEFGGEVLTITLLDKENIRVVLGAELMDAKYEISALDLIITNQYGDKRMFGTFSKDKKEIVLNTGLFEIPFTLFLSD